MAAQKPLSLPGHDLVPAPSPPPRGTVTYLAGTACSQGTRDTGRSRTRCPVPARRRALGDRESGRALSTLPAREAQRVPPTAPTTTRTSSRGAREAPVLKSNSEACGAPGISRPGAGVPDPAHTQGGKVAKLSAPTRAHPFHSEALGTRATLAPWRCGKDFGLGLGMWGRAGSFLGPLRRVSERTLKRFFVVLALVYFYFPGI